MQIGELKKLVGVGNICYCMCFWMFQGTMFSSRMKPGSTCSSKKNQFSQEPSNTVAISWTKKLNQLTSWKLRTLSSPMHQGEN
ncbi:hypothetical protein GQ55_9G262800 [Panicum hallii var. hallii]|uniref:Uncharacterized protein n=1 Tax=Panicum hallii var. hallii TaxID=1504633 RepID=A0A2T7C740_9POAL|nr:hypothetical protein GQ55_9G262800 [Panicum hallii var. hallii]